MKKLCNVILDRITVNGVFHPELYGDKLHENHWVRIDKKDVDHRPTMYALKRINENGELVSTTNIATLIKNKRQQNRWRLDTSNHIESEEEKRMITNIIALFDEPHITRLDIAIDFINFDEMGMKYRFYKSGNTEEWHIGTNKGVETIYCGSKSSKLFYRYYDKKKEQKRQKKKIPPDIDNWERLEIVLKDKKYTSNWLKEVQKALSYFKYPKLEKLVDKNVNAFLKLSGLREHPECFNKLSSATKARYRKMLNSNEYNGYENDFANVAMKQLTENMDTIQAEINGYLNITNEMVNT